MIVHDHGQFQAAKITYIYCSNCFSQLGWKVVRIDISLLSISILSCYLKLIVFHFHITFSGCSGRRQWLPSIPRRPIRITIVNFLIIHLQNALLDVRSYGPWLMTCKYVCRENILLWNGYNFQVPQAPAFMLHWTRIILWNNRARS